MGRKYHMEIPAISKEIVITEEAVNYSQELCLDRIKYEYIAVGKEWTAWDKRYFKKKINDFLEVINYGQ